MSSEANYGKRIKFNKSGKTLVSCKIYHAGDKVIRVIIDTEEVTFKLIDPVTGVVHKTGGEGIKNMEVLQRHVKSALKEMGIRFDKEKRAVTEPVKTNE